MSTPERIKLVREAMGLSPDELGELIGLSGRKIAALEKGDQEASPEELWNISQMTQTDLGFFLRTLPVLPVAVVSDRLEKLSDEDRSRVTSQVRLWLERYYDIESFFEIEDIPLPAMPEGFPYPVKNGRDAADAADRLRVIWRLGINPVKSLTDLLEELGIKVGMVPGAAGFDGAAFETDDDVTLPLIIVNRNLSGEDQRFALARELSYFFLNGANAQLANHFAASFLVPTDALLKDLGRQRDNIEIYEIFMLKQKYGISMRRLFTRAASLRIISGSELEEWMELFEEMGWKDAEPGGPYPPEISRRILMLVLRLQAEGQITEERAAEMLGVPAEYWDDLLHFRPLRDIEAEEESDEETVAEEEGEEGDEEPIAEESAEGEE